MAELPPLTPTVVMVDKRPWHRQPGETAKAHHAFLHYLRIPAWDRSMVKAYHQHMSLCKGIADPTTNPVVPQSYRHAAPVEWFQWRTRWGWQARLEAWDADQAERQRLIEQAEVDAMNRRHVQMALALNNLVVDRLRTIGESHHTLPMSAREMAYVTDKSAVIERRARGLATSKVESEQTITDHSKRPMLDLSKLTEQQLATFEQLLRLAQASDSTAE